MLFIPLSSKEGRKADGWRKPQNPLPGTLTPAFFVFSILTTYFYQLE
jgi:hypothetical protein